MEIRNLGRTGLKVTKITLGTMTFGNQADRSTSFEILDVADSAGINFFDTADVYPFGGDAASKGRTEEIVGEWIKERNARDRIVLATKVRGSVGPGPNDAGLSRKHIFKAVEDSLTRLRTDYIDLYQIHSADASTPIDETLGALNDLVHAGKVRYIGASNLQAWQLAEALWTSDKRGWARFDSIQPRYNILYRAIEDEILPLVKSQQLGVIPYNPLAGGLLTGRYKDSKTIEPGTRFSLGRSGEMYQRRYWKDENFDQIDRLKNFFSERNKSLTHVALAWVLSNPLITSAIIGASRPDQLRDSLQGADLILDSEEKAITDDVWFTLPRERDPQLARR